MPAVAFIPDQPEEAVQVVAFVDDQESAEEKPEVMVLGFADMETLGAGTTGAAEVTLIVRALVVAPPAPTQYAATAYGPTVLSVRVSEPDVGPA